VTDRSGRRRWDRLRSRCLHRIGKRAIGHAPGLLEFGVEGRPQTRAQRVEQGGSDGLVVMRPGAVASVTVTESRQRRQQRRQIGQAVDRRAQHLHQFRALRAEVGREPGEIQKSVLTWGYIRDSAADAHEAHRQARIANGLPLAAIVSSKELQERWGLGAHGTTFGGNPVSCAAGIAVLETIHGEGLLANAAARGAQLEAGLRELTANDKRVGDIRGLGLMLGVEFVRDGETREPDGDIGNAVIARCADEGLLILNCGAAHNVVRWVPPLNATADEVDEALGIFGQVLGAL